MDFLSGRVTLLPGDCMEVLKTLPENSVDSVCTDPPYHLTSIVKRFSGEKPAASNMHSATEPPNRGAQYKRLSRGFMGQQWDGGDIAFRAELWTEVLRVLKPGGHMFAFSGTRTYHRMAVAIEDAGFEIRDQFAWMYGSGFPKSHDVSKAIDKAAGDRRGRAGAITIESQPPKGAEYERTDKGEPITDAARHWQGWGTAVKPAWEPIVLARKPLSERTVAANVLRWGTGALNIDGCRVGTDGGRQRTGEEHYKTQSGAMSSYGTSAELVDGLGRFPANIIHDGSDEVVAAFPERTSAGGAIRNTAGLGQNGIMGGGGKGAETVAPQDSGSAARFFYTSKADSIDRAGSGHPTVKPVDLMQYLCRMITPPGGTVLDLFAGSGTTGEAAYLEGFRAVLIEREAKYQEDIAKRMRLVEAPDRVRKVESARKVKAGAYPLFDE